MSAALTLVIAQRLVRRVCPNCGRPTHPTDEQIATLNLSSVDLDERRFRLGMGCDHCDDTGYRGRLGVHELMSADGKVGQQLVAGGDSAALGQAALASGMHSLRDDALLKARQGYTSLEEVLRVTPHDVVVEGACPTCGRPVEPDYDYCPWCIADLRSAQCRTCAHELHSGWRVCPRCATPTGSGGQTAPSDASV